MKIYFKIGWYNNSGGLDSAKDRTFNFVKFFRNTFNN
jgi:hypothetical protein